MLGVGWNVSQSKGIYGIVRHPDAQDEGFHLRQSETSRDFNVLIKGAILLQLKHLTHHVYHIRKLQTLLHRLGSVGSSELGKKASRRDDFLEGEL